VIIRGFREGYRATFIGANRGPRGVPEPPDEGDVPILAELAREAERIIDVQLRAFERAEDRSDRLMSVSLAVLGGGLSVGAFVSAGDLPLTRDVALSLVVVGAAYLGASWWAARIAHKPGAVEVARSFAHTLIPIALAYAVAHYFTLILFEGQLIVPALSDPLGLGWNLFGTVDFKPNYTWLAPTAVWYVQVAAIVGGHLIGVVLAHDRALAVFPADRAVRSQYAMLALMVAFTTLGLTILAV